jgi:invasion protein IalB
MSFGYELNKNIVYYDGFIQGYLHKEIEDWSIICEVKNNDRCLLTQFLEIQIDESTQTFLVFIIKEMNKNYLVLRSKLNDESQSSKGDIIKIMALSNSGNEKFELMNTNCTMDYCEYAGLIPDDFLNKLKNKDDFMIGVGNKKNNKNIGIMIEMNGFPEMFQALSKNEIKN